MTPELQLYADLPGAGPAREPFSATPFPPLEAELARAEGMPWAPFFSEHAVIVAPDAERGGRPGGWAPAEAAAALAAFAGHMSGSADPAGLGDWARGAAAQAAGLPRDARVLVCVQIG